MRPVVPQRSDTAGAAPGVRELFHTLLLVAPGRVAPGCMECADRGPLHPHSAAGADECTRRFWR